jgi:hypothetical protein
LIYAPDKGSFLKRKPADKSNSPKALFQIPPKSEDMRNIRVLQAPRQAWLVSSRIVDKRYQGRLWRTPCEKLGAAYSKGFRDDEIRSESNIGKSRNRGGAFVPVSY